MIQRVSLYQHGHPALQLLPPYAEPPVDSVDGIGPLPRGGDPVATAEGFPAQDPRSATANPPLRDGWIFTCK